MKINNDENYLQAMRQLNTLAHESITKNSELAAKLETVPKTETGTNEKSNKENTKNMQEGLESNYLDRTQPNRGQTGASKKKPADAQDEGDGSGGGGGGASAEPKGAKARLDLSEVNAEIKALKQQQQALQRQANAATGSEEDKRAAKAQLSQLEAEIKQKDSKNYKLAHGKKIVTPL